MNEALLQKVLTCSKLPTLPAVALRVLELTGDDNVTMNDLARVIENDQGLAAKILRTINSAFYALPRECTTLSHAQALLGLNAIKSLALGFSLVQTLTDGMDEGFDFPSYWRRSIYSAVGAKAVSSMVRSGEAEECFLAGLLQNLGMIALLKTIGSEYANLVNSCGDDHRALVKAELAEFELQHSDVGAMLGERWKLPAAILMPIKYHERPTAAPILCRPIVRAVALGNLIADILIQRDRAYWLTQYYQRANEWFSLSAMQADEILGTVTHNARDVAALFEVDMGPTPNASEILEIAGERLATIALQESRNAMEVAAENAEFRRSLDFDSLTGLGSRRRFIDEVTTLFEKAKLEDTPLSVLFFDADRFRAINEQYGEEMGDIMVVRLAQRLSKLLAREGAELHRYAGEEFGAVMLGVDRITAMQIGEMIREAVAEELIAFDGGADLLEREAEISSPIRMDSGADRGAVRITLSVGVATLERESVETLTRAERLIHAADKAVHASKHAGGNCVRAFTPKRRAAA